MRGNSPVRFRGEGTRVTESPYPTLLTHQVPLPVRPTHHTRRQDFPLPPKPRTATIPCMPRTARASVGGLCYHALNRGNGRAQVFHDADDYHGFLRLLRQACARLPMRLLGFCLM